MRDCIKRTLVEDEQGSTLLIALVVIVLLTIIGFAAVNESTVEIQVAHNDRLYHEQFYLAENAAMEGLQTVADSASIGQEPTAGDGLSPSEDLDGALTYSVENNGIAAGYSATVGSGSARRMRSFTITGKYESDSGRSEIELGANVNY